MCLSYLYTCTFDMASFHFPEDPYFPNQGNDSWIEKDPEEMVEEDLEEYPKEDPEEEEGGEDMEEDSEEEPRVNPPLPSTNLNLGQASRA